MLPNALRILGVLCVCLSLAHAQGMSVEDILDLKKAGFTEKEVREEIARAKAKPMLDDAGATRLKAAGFSDTFIAKLRSAGGGVTLDGIRAMQAKGSSATGILRAIANSPQRPKPTAQQALELTRAGVPAIVVRALRGGGLNAAEALRLVKGGASGDELSALIDVVGTKGKPSAAQALALMRAGVPDTVVRRLRTGEGGSVTRTADGMALYEHPAGRFSVRYPAGWRHMLNVQKEDIVLEFVYTPDASESDPERLSTGFSVLPLQVAPGTSLAIASLDDLVGLILPVVLAEEPGLKVQKETRSGRLAGKEARFVELRGKMKARGDQPLRLTAAVMREDGVVWLVSAWAPVGEYDKLSDTFGKCAQSLRFGNPPPFSHRKATTSQDFVDRYRKSVVQVRTKIGTGTGFIVRKDGYVLTNHHVVYDEKKKELLKEFTLHFDASLKRRPLRAVLIGSKRGGDTVTFTNLAGREVDIALLKITDPGTFDPLPITPLSDVKLSDPIVTMGYPYSSVFGGAERLSMFVTRGVVVRFNKDLWGRTEGLFIDAKITHGNSGGPCIDLSTGGVIGLNTWGFNMGTSAIQVELVNNLVGYNGVVPIDATLNEWPDILKISVDREQRLTTDDRLILAVDYLGRDQFGAAERQAARVVEARPDSADARFLLAVSLLQLGRTKEFTRQLDAALVANPKHYQALILKAQMHARNLEFAEASVMAERAIQSHPDSPFPYLARGALFMLVKRYEDALADADKAALLGQNVSSDPDLLAGEALYEMGKLDAGRARFGKANEVTPGRFEALMGSSEYFERKKMYEAALLEYGKVAARYPLSPLPQEAIGRCFVELKQLAKARDAYRKATGTYAKHSLNPPEEVFAQLIRIHEALGEQAELLNTALSRANTYPVSVPAHVQLAVLVNRQVDEAQAIAWGHAAAALQLSGGADEVRKAVAQLKPAALSLNDIRVMEKAGYGRAALVVFAFAPIAFKVDQTFIKGLGEKVSPFVVRAIEIIAARQRDGDLPRGNRPPPAADPSSGKRIWSAADGSMRLALPPGLRLDPDVVKLPPKDRFVKMYAEDGKGLTVMAWAFAPGVTLDQAYGEYRRFMADRNVKVELKGNADIKGGAQKLVHGEYTSNGTLYKWIAVFAAAPQGLRAVFQRCSDADLNRYLSIRNGIIDSFVVASGTRPAPERGKTTPPPPGDVPPPPGGGNDPRENKPVVDDGIPAPGETGNGPAIKVDPRQPTAGAGWSSRDGTFSIPLPRGYTRVPQREKLIRDNGFGWVEMVADNKQLGCDLTAFVFAQRVRSFDDCEALIGQFMSANGVELTLEKKAPIKVGDREALHAWGTGGNAQMNFAWETILVRTRNGVRGFWMQAYGADRSRFKEPRDFVVSRMRFGGAAKQGEGAPGEGDVATWQDPQKRMSIRYPRSYRINQQAAQSNARNGIDFLPMLAADGRAQSDFFMTSFSAPILGVDQALKELIRFQAGRKARMTVVDRKDFKVGVRDGKLVSGRLVFPNGLSIRWEGVLVPTQTGVRGVVFFGHPDTWKQTFEHRKTIFTSLKVLR